MGEVHVTKLWVAVKSKGPPDESIELTDKKVGQVKRSHLVFCALCKSLDAIKESVAMRALYQVHPKSLAGRFQKPASATVCINNKYLLKAGISCGCNGRLNGGCNFLGVVMIDRGQTLQVHMRPAIGLNKCQNLTREGAASNKPHAGLGPQGRKTFVG